MSSNEANEEEVNSPTETNTSSGIDTGTCVIPLGFFSLKFFIHLFTSLSVIIYYPKIKHLA